MSALPDGLRAIDADIPIGVPALKVARRRAKREQSLDQGDL